MNTGLSTLVNNLKPEDLKKICFSIFMHELFFMFTGKVAI